MSGSTNTGKQLLIQIGINIVASAIVSYIMYKVLQPKDETITTAKTVSTSIPQVKAVATTPEAEVIV